MIVNRTDTKSYVCEQIPLLHRGHFTGHPASTKIPTAIPPFSGSNFSTELLLTLELNRKSQIKYGGRKTGSTYISAPRWDRKEIPNATPTLLGSSFSMELSSTLWGQTGSQKSNNAAAKPEVLISQVLAKVDTKFQMLHPHCMGPASQWICGIHFYNNTKLRNQYYARKSMNK